MSFSQLGVSTNALAADGRSLNTLKLQAGQNSPAAVKEAAKQFESLFMRELIKSMREATMKSGMLESAGGDLGTDLLDQQLSVHMSGMPGGLSDMIARQLSQQTAAPAATAAPEAATRAGPAPITLAPTGPLKTHSHRPPSCSATAQLQPGWSRTAGCPRVSCSGRLVTRPAGAAARSA